MRALAEIVRLRTGDCRDAADAIAQMAAGEDGIDPELADHVGACLRCQAELAAFRRIMRTMRAMRHDVIDPPPGSLTSVLAALEAAGEMGSPSWALRAAYVGGITVATGAAGVLVWINRRRFGLADAG